MKKRYKLLYIFLLYQLYSFTVLAQTPNFLWAKQSEGQTPNSNDDSGRSVATDAQGNNYVTGHFKGIATFGTTTLTSSGLYDIFIAKYNASGTLLWVKQAGGTGDDQGYSIAVDGSGNSYVTGHFKGIATFGTTTLTSSGLYDIFIAKYNASGILLWAQQAGGARNDSGKGIAVDGSGNSYVAGYFEGITATFGTTTFTSYGGNDDVFIAKYDASGNILWVKQAGGTGSEKGFGIAVDAIGNSYVTGYYTKNAIFGSTTLPNNSNSDNVFIAKYNASGTLLWVKQAGGSGIDWGLGIAIDGSGNCYLTGDFMGSATFDNTTITSSGIGDVFIAKYDALGTLVWAKQAGGTSADQGCSIAVDGSSNSYVTGFFKGSATFGGTTLTSSGGSEIFLAKYDPSGNLLWLKQTGGANDDYGLGIAVDVSGNSCVTGYFKSTAINFDSTTLAANGTEMFIAKIGKKHNLSTGIIWNPVEPAAISISPNPNQGKFKLQLSNFAASKAEVAVSDLLGRIVFQKEALAVNNQLSEELDLPIAKGIYLLQLTAGENILTRKIVIE